MPSPIRPVEEIWAEEERRKKQEKEREREKRKRREREKAAAAASSSSSERDDKRAKKLIGDVVVPIMSKHKSKIDRDNFKRYAQQCTELLMEKEKKGKDYGKFCRLTSIPDEKRKKIQNFTSDFTARLLKKMEDKAKSKKAGQEGLETNGNGSASHETSTTPGESFVVATPELPASTSLTPANDASEENYGESDLEMDHDMDAELEDHTFSVMKDKVSS
jgi:histone-lysine N-methyltransferase SETD2